MSMLVVEFLRKIQKLELEELIALDGIGPILAENILEFVQSKRYQKLLEDFENLEKKDKSPILIESPSQNFDQSPALNRQIVCITGTFLQSREFLKLQLEQMGAKVVETVTKKTDLLLCGQNPGSKLEKAQNLGIRIVFDPKELIPKERLEKNSSQIAF